ncbi:MAG: tRNA (adenosine(37)-N6)-threonylcarbamoyltransferase complex ATPase subunit type 1 TsaE, partial [Smithella sp.]
MSQKNTKIEIISESARQTEEIACFIGRELREGDVLALSGELGSGKTCFTGGLARGLGVSDKYQITSPTFTLINEYPARCKLYH